MAKCAICERTFGLTLWKHSCVLCRRVVCGECSSSSVPVSESAVQATPARAQKDDSSSSSDGDSQDGKKSVKGKKDSAGQKTGKPTSTPGVVTARVCTYCQENGKTAGGHRLGGGNTTTNNNPNNKSDSTQASSPGFSAQQDSKGGNESKPDPNSASEREKRARLIEARMNSKKGPSSSSAATGAARPKPPPPAPVKVSPPAAAVTPIAPTTTATTPTTPSTTTTATRTGAGTNPALEAALRRQQQHRQETPSGPERNYSEEKRRLLREIDAIHAKTGTDAPFGLKAADEARLRSYRQHLQTTYNM